MVEIVVAETNYTNLKLNYNNNNSNCRKDKESLTLPVLMMHLGSSRVLCSWSSSGDHASLFCENKITPFVQKYNNFTLNLLAVS